MKRRSTYFLLLVLLFAKSYVSALPANAVPLAAGTIQQASRHNRLSDAGNAETIIQHPSIINDDDNEEDDDYAPALKKQVLVSDDVAANSIFAKGFLVHQFKNTFSPNNFYSSWPPTYLRLRVIRI